MAKKVKRGFTLVEVGLFLAVTGALFVGIVAGVQGSMFQQRYNDSIQDFAEFLRTVYSQTANVQGNLLAGGGRSDKAIYGKLVTFGEAKNLEGNTNEDKTIFSYTVIGDADGDIASGDVIDSLVQARVNVFSQEGSSFKLAGIVDQYFPRWGAGIQTTKGSPYVDFKGAILIVRHPSSGTVFTYIYDGGEHTLEINRMMRESITMPEPLSEANLKKFKVMDLDFCINPEPEKREGVRRDIRLVAGARNASGVEVIAQDDNTPGSGNRCQR